jgi:ubiquinone/menaquinone biosynthesis C-methylase UbiE/uncharacterized protein YbaR (Trm112 family)
MPPLRNIPFVCPLCKGPLAVSENGYGCESCLKDFPLHDGIPDFRVFPDPYLDYEEDRQRTNIVLEALNRFDLRTLLEYYWSLSDVTPVELRGNFIRSTILGEHKAKRILRILSDRTFNEPVCAEKVIELGSGTGNFLATASHRFRRIIGVDIAMRWLHVSRRRFMDKGLEIPPLVCCCAEYLPFPDGYFDLAVSSATLEFTRDQEKVLFECARVLKKSGCFYLSTVNRFAITQDPYVYLWGVGFLPRSWQAGYVKWRRKASYEHIRLFSLNELKILTNKYFKGFEIALPDIDNESLRQFPQFKQLQVKVYRVLKKIRIFRSLLLLIAPQWDLKLKKFAN